MQQYRIIRTLRKTISIEITPFGEVFVRVPRAMTDEAVRRFVESKGSWIEAHLPDQPVQSPLTEAEIKNLARQAAQILPERVAHFAPLVGISYGRITIRSQRTRWGSCSDRGNLNFNCLLMLVPEAVRDYVVVHELCHRRELNHSGKFWAEVERVLPDWREHRRWLKENGNALIARLPGPGGEGGSIQYDLERRRHNGQRSSQK